MVCKAYMICDADNTYLWTVLISSECIRLRLTQLLKTIWKAIISPNNEI